MPGPEADVPLQPGGVLPGQVGTPSPPGLEDLLGERLGHQEAAGPEEKLVVLGEVLALEVPGQEENTVYLPFWKISAVAEGLEINSFADFVRLTNQPRVVGKEWEDLDMSFWSPAFKIRPKVYLNLSRQFTISQQNFQTEEALPKKNLYPVTLPQTEAAQSMKITLANSTLNKKKVLPHLPRVRFNIKGSTLVYLPFTDTNHELVQQHLRISINKNTLQFGRQL